MSKSPDKKETRLGGEDNLPLTRWQLLGDTLHFRFWDLFLVSLLTFIFFVPTFAWLIFASLSGFLDYGNLTSIALTYGVNVLALMVGGLGMAGVFYFSKKLAWGEGATIPEDFFEGMRKNAPMFVIVYGVVGILYLLLRIDVASIANDASLSGVVRGTLEGLSYAVFFLFLLALLFVQTQTVIYQGGFFQLAWNGFKFLFGAFLSNIPMFLVYFLMFLCFEFIPYAVASYITIGLSALFYFGFSTFAFTLYSDSLFDKSINPRLYPEIIRKGLKKIAPPGDEGKVEL